MPNEMGELTQEEFDYSAFYADLFKPGRNIVSDGERGGGKTHTAMAYAEMILSGRYPFDRIPRTFLLTNVIFMRKDGKSEDEFEEDDPPGVFHISSMEQMFRIMTTVTEENGRDVMFLVVLDEAQNYLLADSNSEETNQNFLRLYGMTRKFSMCLWMLTPAISNLPPRARNFSDHPDKPGYVTARLYKDKAVALAYIRRWHSATNWKQWVTVKLNTNHRPTNPMFVPVTPWTRRPEDVEIGGYFYDTGACADFRTSVSEDPAKRFDFRGFINACSDVSSYRLQSIMKSFFDRTEDGSKKRTETDGQIERILRLRSCSVRWDIIARSEVDPKTGRFMAVTTWQSRCDAYLKRHPELCSDSDSKSDGNVPETLGRAAKPTTVSENGRNGGSFSKIGASIKNENESAGGRARVYIDRDRDGDRGPGAVEGSLSDLHGKDVPAPTETFVSVPGEGDGCP